MREIAILGNGKSLSNIDFTKLECDTMGMCVAFRYWEKVNWYPTYYCCVDYVVLKSHIEKIKEMVINKKCKKFLFTKQILCDWYEAKDYESIIFLEDLQQNKRCLFRYLVDWCSGSAGYVFSLFIGYQKISLFGIDCNYVEFLPQCKQLQNGTLEITETPKENPNYFFNDYQRKGDNYNVPNGTRIHRQSWHDAAFLTAGFAVVNSRPLSVTNYNKKENESIREAFETKEISEYFELSGN